MSQDGSRFGCPECESDQNLLMHELKLYVHASRIQARDEEGKPSQTHLYDEGYGQDPEDLGVDLNLADLTGDMRRFHCTSCGIAFDEPAHINDGGGRSP